MLFCDGLIFIILSSQRDKFRLFVQKLLLNPCGVGPGYIREKNLVKKDDSRTYPGKCMLLFSSTICGSHRHQKTSKIIQEYFYMIGRHIPVIKYYNLYKY